ncbi:unnamed protein product [Ectocarpus sp. CCAP 1310/34]|nr:unnamed protein product [Ectocarpus sp. CCAP 1310/34]
MVNPAMDQPNQPPLPFPAPGGGGHTNGHHASGPSSSAITNGDAGLRMGVNQTVATVAGDLEGLVHAWDKTRGAMDFTVDESLRTVAYSVAENRVHTDLRNRGIEIVDDSRAKESKSWRHSDGSRTRSTSSPRRPRKPRSLPPSSLSRSRSPLPSPSPSAARGGGGSGFSGGEIARHEEEDEDGLQVTGFDLRSALKCESISETRGYLRVLYDLAAQQELMLDEMAREGMYAIELNEKLSLKLADKRKEIAVLKKAYFLAIETDPAATCDTSDDNNNGTAEITAATTEFPGAGAAESLPGAEPTLEAVSSGMTPPPPPRPPLSDSTTAARREHSRAFSGRGIAAPGNGGAISPRGGVEAASNGGSPGAGGGRTRSGSGASVGSGSGNRSVRAELFPAPGAAREGKSKKTTPEVSPRWGNANNSHAMPPPPPPTAFFPTGPPVMGARVSELAAPPTMEAAAGVGDVSSGGAFGGPGQGGGVVEDPLKAMMMPPAPPQMKQSPETGRQDDAAEDSGDSKNGINAPPALAPPPVLPHPGLAVSYRAVRQAPVGGVAPPPTAFVPFGGGGGGVSAFGGGGAAMGAFGRGGAMTAPFGGGGNSGSSSVDGKGSEGTDAAAATAEGGGGDCGTTTASGGGNSSTTLGSSVGSFTGSFGSGRGGGGGVDAGVAPAEAAARQPPPQMLPEVSGGGSDGSGAGVGGEADAPGDGPAAAAEGEGAAMMQGNGFPDGGADAPGVGDESNGGGGQCFGGASWAREEETNEFFAGV